jgi:hypothetical protein
MDDPPSYSTWKRDSEQLAHGFRCYIKLDMREWANAHYASYMLVVWQEYVQITEKPYCFEGPHCFRSDEGTVCVVKASTCTHTDTVCSERYLDFPCNARSLTRPALQSTMIFVVTHTLLRRLYVSLHLTATLSVKQSKALLQKMSLHRWSCFCSESCRRKNYRRNRAVRGLSNGRHSLSEDLTDDS